MALRIARFTPWTKERAQSERHPPFVRRLTGSFGHLSMDTANAISSRGHSTTLATGSYGASCLHTFQTDGSHIVLPTAAARYHNSPTSTIAVRRIPDVPPASP